MTIEDPCPCPDGHTPTKRERVIEALQNFNFSKMFAALRTKLI